MEASVQERGTVKSYNAAKGFGFIVLDGADTMSSCTSMRFSGRA